MPYLCRIMNAHGFDPHDHDHCIADALSAAQDACAARKLNLTPVRRRVLEILLQQHKAMGAYDILSKLEAEGLGSQPPVAYRALDFLVSNGFAHKIEGLNAYIACSHPNATHAPAFLICRKCGKVQETQSEPAKGTLGSVARAAGFVIESTVVEAQGLCPACQDIPQNGAAA